MLIIVQGQANDIIVTLKEKQTLTNPNFLFVFKNKQSKIVATCIAPDTSDFTYRYNEFSITETVLPNGLNAEVYLPNVNEHHYEVYEQVSATNLNPSLADNILEIGFVKVFGTKTVIPYFVSHETSLVTEI